MNRFYTFMIFGMLCMFTSCDKDSTDFQSVVGQWKMTEVYTDNGVSTSSFQGSVLTYTYTFYGKDFSTVTTFTENPNMFSSTGTYTAVVTADVGGVISTTETVAPNFGGSGEWSIDGDMMTQTIAGQDQTFRILELSNEKLRLRFDEDVTFSDNGVTVNNKATVFASFERL